MVNRPLCVYLYMLVWVSAKRVLCFYYSLIWFFFISGFAIYHADRGKKELIFYFFIYFFTLCFYSFCILIDVMFKFKTEMDGKLKNPIFTGTIISLLLSWFCWSFQHFFRRWYFLLVHSGNSKHGILRILCKEHQSTRLCGWQNVSFISQCCSFSTL